MYASLTTLQQFRCKLFPLLTMNSGHRSRESGACLRFRGSGTLSARRATPPLPCSIMTLVIVSDNSIMSVRPTALCP